VVVEVPRAAPSKAVGKARLAKPRQTAFRIEESCLTRDPDQSSSGVEDRHQQQREHDNRETELEGAGKIHLEEGRRERGRPRGKAVPGLKTESDRDQRHAEHADDDAAWNFPRGETGDDKEARSSEKGLRLPQIAERDQRHGIVGDDARVLQSDQSKKEPDARGDAELQIHGEGIDQPGAQGRERQREEEHAGDEDESQRKLPIALKLGHHGKSEIRVEPHARGERDRIVGVKPHDDGARRRGEAGGDEHRANVHAGLLQDRRIDEHDVGHGEEGREPSTELGRDARAGGG
jgi:hypothetical protein